MVATKLDERIAVSKEKAATLAAARAKRAEILETLLAAHRTVETEGKAAGRAIADSVDAAPAKARLGAAIAEAAALDSALEVITERVHDAQKAARAAEVEAGLAEIEALKVEAAECCKETLRAADALGKSHARWHALARRAERVATVIGRAHAPIAYEGTHGQLCPAPDEGGIPGALAKYGVSANFGAIRERLPIIEPKNWFATLAELDDEEELDEDEPGVEISVENVPLSEADAYTRRH